MECESFEDEQVAAFLNENYVAIKVDREERPDVDHVYMTVCQAVTGQGGWPLTIIMTPDKKPFFAGTYLPKEAKWGRLGLVELLTIFKQEWNQNKDKINEFGQNLVNSIKEQSKKTDVAKGILSETVLANAFKQLLDDFDPTYGGFGPAPKFPTPHNLMFLLRYFHRTKDKKAIAMVVKTLDGMKRGGMYDHLGYGFARYSTDNKWLAPHFEKMLYDNALLCYVFTEAYQCTGNYELAKTAEEIITYVLRDMTGPDGQFYSAQDADSEGVEGKFYVWTRQEILDILGQDVGNLFANVYGVTEKGNFEHSQNILNLISRDLCDYASQNNIDFVRLNEDMAKARGKLYSAREKRIHPFKDDKTLTAWNSLMIAAMAKAGRVLERPDFIEAAKRAMEFVYNKLFREDGRLLARYRDGEAAHLGYIDDYVFLLWGLIELYESTFEPKYLTKSLIVVDDLKELFWDSDKGGFFFIGSDGEELIIRRKEIYDGAIPSGNSVAALLLLKLARITNNDEYMSMAEQIFDCFSKEVVAYPRAYTFFISAFDYYLWPPTQIVIASGENDEKAENMLTKAHKVFLPEAVILFNDPRYAAQNETLLPHIIGQKAVDGQSTAYVCENFSCQRPLKSEAELEKVLKKI